MKTIVWTVAGILWSSALLAQAPETQPEASAPDAGPAPAEEIELEPEMVAPVPPAPTVPVAPVPRPLFLPQAAGAVTNTVTRSDGTEEREIVALRRTSSGALVPGRRYHETVAATADGRSVTRRVEQARTINGTFAATREIEATTTMTDENTMVTTSVIRSPDHRSGRMTATARETTTQRIEGDTVHSDTVTSEPVGTRWVVKQRLETTETVHPDGSTARETIIHERPRYSQFTPRSTEPLRPSRKLVEREIPQPDGSVRTEREVYRRDVNGNWVPQSFSTVPPTAADPWR